MSAAGRRGVSSRAEHGPLWHQLLTLGLIFLATGLVWDSVIGLCAGRLGRGQLRGWRTALVVNLVAGATSAVLVLGATV
ncbi:hypothetical protein GCM10010277_06680 [Streptomyces longisporoflavus]|nr:hypothetical protein GCM10010277_06680 [Streptomyces longisporoflavus]